MRGRKDLHNKGGTGAGAAEMTDLFAMFAPLQATSSWPPLTSGYGSLAG